MKVGDRRVFRMADPAKGTSAPGFTVSAVCVAVAADTVVWLDDESSAEPEALEAMLDAVARVVLPRCRALLGQGVEPDDDGALTILVSHRLNEGGLAVGFFNPCDFFPYSDDPASNDYNPTSNEEDIVYVGMPVPAGVDRSYRPEAIAATVAHEYQHLVRFGHKTYARLLNGDPAAPIEDPAFDEGASHLMESVVGYGLSGGNLRFLACYLDEPERFSLCYSDADGATDSAGKRGLAALFLVTLAFSEGAARYDDSAPAIIAVPDSFSIITESMKYPGSGWEYLASQYGEPLSALWTSFCLELRTRAATGYTASLGTDPITGEPTNIDAFMGVIPEGASSEIHLSGPTMRILEGAIPLPAMGAIFWNALSIASKSSYQFSSSGSASCLVGFLMK